MRILLTGASGFIGTHVSTALLAEGFQLTCTTRRAPPHAHTGKEQRVRLIEADFARDTAKAAWLPRLDGIDVVINCVGIIAEHGAQTFAALHTQAPRALFAACAESEVQLVIQLSALGADDGAVSPYHLSKKAADDFLAGLPLRAVIVQPSLVYGDDGGSARLFRMLASLPVYPRFGRAPQPVQPVHVDDLSDLVVALVRGAGALGGQKTRRVPVVGPQALPFTAYLAALRAAMGLGRLRVAPLPRLLMPPMLLLARLLGFAMPDRATLGMLDRGNTADAGLTRRLLGRAPRPVAQFISDARGAAVRAQLDWLLPVLRMSIAIVWIATAIVSAGVYPLEDSYRLLERSGVPPDWAPLLLAGACLFDLLLGMATVALRPPWRRWLWPLQAALIVFYTVWIAVFLPEFLWHPYGPLTKNLPMLAALWLLYQLEEKPWNT
ncbi:SDR family oxidoreductase [Janthinobacterium sp. 64]|uniref:SDR family oxidoreductase n=1 Tax=Janthinobacterium sp. 64 TaxID=2035208 RepID=UPI000C2C3411|nr:SDR family oxidoreductase [Janthinobacterium sp. 64]PKB22894.1 nucleoside-diphosphate-sugar epimerase [Janthinobacterium sp. 64]